MFRAFTTMFQTPSAERQPSSSTTAKAVAVIKARLRQLPDCIVFSHVYPPVTPPSRYHTRPEYVSGKRVPLTRDAATKWKKKHTFMSPISEWPEVHHLTQRRRRRRSGDSQKSCSSTSSSSPSSYVHFDVWQPEPSIAAAMY
ncbi:hypothetical protein H257_11314 [Aphanomyces astaci]|uniref:Uncharacterized protein n=1 Tax=Aphanomyces astaci TaxID=112090 RepID=W4G3Z8_APHAT|nr:hypothetical protein H257_11314 [Aphanomyces astaci]ETV74006.1 hypothetical protein H257_11314 [Aphanomyces astaci]|eukprot:XP_009836519.1 hypothetical protein H257_11314 [Aphanomyces astaci]